MRERHHLAAVMRTVNAAVVGQALARAFYSAAQVIETGQQDNRLLWRMANHAAHHTSPHIRELAIESNTYMVLDGL